MTEASNKPAVISVKNEQEAVAINCDSVRLLAEYILNAESASGRGELAITFVDAGEISSLNDRYRGKDGPTDVLSFSLSEDGEDGFVTPVPLMGNVIICPEVAAATALEDDREPRDEILQLVAHGILHILDYGHRTDSDEIRMLKRQAELVDGFINAGQL